MLARRLSFGVPFLALQHSRHRHRSRIKKTLEKILTKSFSTFLNFFDTVTNPVKKAQNAITKNQIILLHCTSGVPLTPCSDPPTTSTHTIIPLSSCFSLWQWATMRPAKSQNCIRIVHGSFDAMVS